MENQTSPPPQPGFLNGFLKFLPVIQWFVMIVIAVCVFALSQRDLQSAQASEVRENTRDIVFVKNIVEKAKEDHNREIERLRGEILTKEVFDAYHKADEIRFTRMEKLLEQLLMQPGR